MSGISPELNKILKEITMLTSNIETNYPELYQYLEEDPSTFTFTESQNEIEVYQNYLSSLKSKLHDHLEFLKENRDKRRLEEV